MKSFALFLAALVVLAVAFVASPEAKACDHFGLQLAVANNHCNAALVSHGAAFVQGHHALAFVAPQKVFVQRQFIGHRQRFVQPQRVIIQRQVVRPQRIQIRRGGLFGRRLNINIR